MLTLCSAPFFAAAFSLGVGAVIPQDEAARTPEPKKTETVLEVRALANEGFLLTAGEDAVVIDAFVSKPYSIYAALAGKPLEHLLAGTGPFETVDLALVSHRHADHFQAEPARSFLAARPDCLFVSSPQVLETLDPKVLGAAETSVRELLPDEGKELEIEKGGIHVDVLRLSHGSGRFAAIQNLGHVITLGGVTALHLGDAAMIPDNFAAYDLPKRGIDVVFVPYWYFGESLGRRIIDEYLRPAKLVACHIPPAEVKKLAARLAKTDPEVVVPQEPLELIQVRDTN